MRSLAKVAHPKDITTKEYVDRLIAEKPDNDTIYDDSELRGKVGTLEGKVQALEGKPDNDTIYDDTYIKSRIQALEGRTDNFITGVTASKEGGKTKLTYTRVTGGDVEVEFEDKDTVTLAYDDTALKDRVSALEGKADKDTTYTAGAGLDLAGTEFAVEAEVLEKVNTADTGVKTLSPKVTILEEKVRQLEEKPDNDTVYDDTALTGRVETLEGVTHIKKYTTTLSGNTTFTVTHNLNTTQVVNSLWLAGEEVLASVVVVDANRLKVEFAEEVTGITIVVMG